MSDFIINHKSEAHSVYASASQKYKLDKTNIKLRYYIMHIFQSLWFKHAFLMLLCLKLKHVAHNKCNF